MVKDISVSPNPTSADFVLTIPTFKTSAQMMIYDAAGKLVMTRKIPVASSNTIPINGIGRAGVYSVIVNGDGKVYSTRVVVN